MRALNAAGDPAAALGRYDALRRRLADELGVDPSRELVEHYEQLLAGGAATPASASAGSHFAALPFLTDGVATQVFRDRLRAPRFGLVVVEGPSGSGKSRLLAEFAREAPCAVARAYQRESAEPFGFVRSLVREVLARDVLAADRLPAPMRRALASVVPEVDTNSASAEVSFDPETKRALVTEAVVRLLGSLIGVVFAIDDAQWCDPTSVAVMESARARLPELRLVVAVRTDEPVPAHVQPLSSSPDTAARIGLAGMGADVISRVVADPELVSALLDATDRTPLAVNEVLHSLGTEDLLARGRDGRWHRANDTAIERARALGAQGQRRAIARRVALHTSDRQRLLEALALHGGETGAGLLAVLTGRGVDAVHDDLSLLHSSGLVRVGENGWATSHDMVRESVAGDMLDSARVAMHATLARVLEEAQADPATCAHHWREAREVDRATLAYERAAQRALDTFADAEAEALASTGLDLDPPQSRAARLREIRGQARARRGALADAREDLRASLAATAPGDGRARLLAQLASLSMGADDLVRASELAELAVIESGDDVSARAQALEIAAVLDMNLYRVARADERFAAVLKQYQELGDAAGVARVTASTAMKTFIHGDVRGGGDALFRAADLFEDSGDLVHMITPRSTAGHARLFAGDDSAAVDLTSAALDAARTLGHVEGQAYAMWHRSEALTSSGRVPEALADAQEALEIAQRIGHRAWTATAWRALGIAKFAKGDFHAALAAFEKSLAESEHFDLFGSWAHSRIALTSIALGDLDRARAHVPEALRIGPALGHYEARLAEAELAAAMGDAAAAACLARTALALAEAGGVAQGNERLAELAARAAP
jgi:tetratricopeptide (TPR) repeat protein